MSCCLCVIVPVWLLVLLFLCGCLCVIVCVVFVCVVFICVVFVFLVFVCVDFVCVVFVRVVFVCVVFPSHVSYGNHLNIACVFKLICEWAFEFMLGC